MARKNTVSPSTQGVRPAMKKMYDGRNTATRPIPIIVDQSEIRAINAAAADAKPKTSAVNFPQSGTRVKGVDVVFGSKTASPGNVIKGGTFSPLTGTENFE